MTNILCEIKKSASRGMRRGLNKRMVLPRTCGFLGLLTVTGLAGCIDEERTADRVNQAKVSAEAAKINSAGQPPHGDHGVKSSSASDTLQQYRNQTVYWKLCDPTILSQPERAQDNTTLFDDFGSRLQCADIRTPLDYNDVNRGDVSISVMRLAAGEPKKRRGALIFNPGGPGGDGLRMSLQLWGAFRLSNPAVTQGAKNLRLLAEYDMIGFSPRGTGASTNAHCASNELGHYLDFTPDGVAKGSFNKRIENAKKTAEACLKNPLIPFFNSSATARDMDLIREILGDQKLNYFGYSYGTWLGARYASLFPDRVDRMVLDGLTDITASFEQTFLQMPTARQRFLNEVMLPYAIRHPEKFNLGTNASEISRMIESLDPDIKIVLGNALSGAGYYRSRIDNYLPFVKSAEILDRVLKGPPATPGMIRFKLDNETYVVGDAAQDALARRLAMQLYADYLKHNNSREKRLLLNISRNDALWQSVMCNDSSATPSLSEWDRLLRVNLRFQSLFIGVARNPVCAFWSAPPAPVPSLEGMSNLDVLLVNSEYDTATAERGAEAAFKALPNSHYVRIPGEFHHGVYPYTDLCVDRIVADYMLGDKPEGRRTECKAHELKFDVAPVAPRFGMAAQSINQPDVNPDGDLSYLPVDHPLRAYNDPVEASRLIRQFKEGIGLQEDGGNGATSMPLRQTFN